MHRPTVLLVDPDEDNRTMYALYLQARGFSVAASANAEDAMLKASHADVVVTGIRLHGTCDGLSLVHWLRSHPFTTKVPIIVLTACVSRGYEDQALAAGCSTFLPKPCLPDRLETEIRMLLSSGGAPRHRPERASPVARIDHRKAS
jgi:CheY-like chemotaxis protein